MKTLAHVFIYLFFYLLSASAQKDTTFYDNDWQVTRREKAAFYRPAPEKIDSGYIIRDYYKANDRL